MMKLLKIKTCLTIGLGLSLCGLTAAQLSTTRLDSSRDLAVRKADIDLRPDSRTLLRASEFVILADIGKSKSRWAEKKIVTDWEIKVREVLKGRPAERLIVTTYGGEIDNIAQDFSHSAQLVSGETAILYLAPISDISAKLSPNGHFIAYDEYGVIRVLRPGERKSRLENNRRMKRNLDTLKSNIRNNK